MAHKFIIHSYAMIKIVWIAETRRIAVFIPSFNSLGWWYRWRVWDGGLLARRLATSFETADNISLLPISFTRSLWAKGSLNRTCRIEFFCHSFMESFNFLKKHSREWYSVWDVMLISIPRSFWVTPQRERKTLHSQDASLFLFGNHFWLWLVWFKN